jgi:hypothetical protein
MKSRITEHSKKEMLKKLIHNQTQGLANKQYVLGLYFGNTASALVVREKFEKYKISLQEKDKLEKLQNLSIEDKNALLIDILQFVEKTLSIKQEEYLEQVYAQK